MLKKRDIDLRDELEILQKDYAIDILFCRSAKYIRCSCFNALHQSGSPACPICLGNGHVTSLQKLGAIHRIGSSFSKDSNAKVTDLGFASFSTIVLYMKYDTLPKVRDHVFITGWDRQGLPQEIQRVYEVVSAKEVRGDSGRVELFNVVTKLKPEMLKPAQDSLSLLGRPARQRIAEGKRYVWPLSAINMT